MRIEILVDTLWLHSDGSARRVVHESLDYVSFRDTVVTSEEPYRCRRRVDRVELEYVCPLNALCTPPPHFRGRVTV